MTETLEPRVRTDEPPSLYFGEIHTHTCLSDGRGEPADAIAQGMAHLDFCALADHAQWPDMPEHDFDRSAASAEWRTGVPALRDRWAEVQALVRDNYQPGVFVPFLGYEWSSDRWGDHNVYYLHDDEPIRYASSLPELYAAVEGVPAMVVPHHTAYPPHHRGYTWEAFDTSKAPFVEIYSVHGSSETDQGPYPYSGNPMGPRCWAGTVRRGLDLGHVFGLMASSDEHGAFPGAWNKGLVAVYAQELTREALWDSFWRRHTYAVTGDRIRLKFELNGSPMGSLISVNAREPRRLRAAVEGWTGLDKVEIIKNGHVVKRWADFDLASTRGARRFRVGVEWGYHGAPHKDVRQWDFLVEAAEGSISAYQPSFRLPGFHRAEIRPPAGVAVHSRTGRPGLGGGYQHMDLAIEGSPVTSLTVRSKERVFLSTTVDQLMTQSKSITPYGQYRGTYFLSRAVAEPHFNADLEWEDVAPGKPRDYYYVRVSQQNGQAAWSSPIWVDRA